MNKEMSYDEWYKTESYKEFCQWWREVSKNYTVTQFCADYAAGDAWRKKDAEILALKAAAKEMAEALEWYANPQTWEDLSDYGDGFNCEAFNDEGTKARDALARYREAIK